MCIKIKDFFVRSPSAPRFSFSPFICICNIKQLNINFLPIAATGVKFGGWVVGIGVGTMGAVGAAAPTIFSHWLQIMYSATTIFWSNTTFSLPIHQHVE